MKKPFFIALIVILHFTINSCGKDEETSELTVTTTDLSVSSSESVISWTDTTDLLQKLDNALSYSYGTALVNETETQQVFNTDTTEVNATIDFKKRLLITLVLRV